MKEGRKGTKGDKIFFFNFFDHTWSMCGELTVQPHVWSMCGPVRYHCRTPQSCALLTGQFFFGGEFLFLSLSDRDTDRDTREKRDRDTREKETDSLYNWSYTFQIGTRERKRQIVFLTTDKAKTSRGGGKRCRCYERRKDEG